MCASLVAFIPSASLWWLLSPSPTPRTPIHPRTHQHRLIGSPPPVPLPSPTGYPLEVHTVTTADGVVLQMERIPRPGCARVAFFLHGILDTSLTWVSSGVTGSQVGRRGQMDIRHGCVCIDTESTLVHVCFLTLSY